MVRVFVLYDAQPDPEQYEQHLAFSREHVPGTVMRHGRVMGGMPDPDAAYYFEYEFPDREAWQASQDGLMAAGKDAMEMGIPFRVYFSEIS